MTMKVPIIRIPFSGDDLALIHGETERVAGSGMLSGGKYTQQFEAQFAAFSGARHAIACTNGTTALELIIRALGIEGKAIIVPTNTFLASALAVMHAGNRVIFADSDPDTLSLDVEDVRRRITPDTAAVMTVHIGGIISPTVNALKRLCDERGLVLIEDAAHAHGSTMDGRGAGTIGVAGGFSFFPTKVLTTGEGGMVVTNDVEVARKCSILRNQGKDPAYQNRISEFGSNHRISEFTAVIGVQQMKKAPKIMEERRAIAAYYDHALGSVQGFRPLVLPENVYSTYYKYVGYLDENIDRAKLKARMREHYGVSLTGEVYADLCHTEPIWERYTYCGRHHAGAANGGAVACHQWPGCGCARRQDGFPGADYIARHHVCLPLYPGLSQAELAHVVTALQAAIKDVREG